MHYAGIILWQICQTTGELSEERFSLQGCQGIGSLVGWGTTGWHPESEKRVLETNQSDWWLWPVFNPWLRTNNPDTIIISSQIKLT